MIIKTETGCIATGRIGKNGPKLKYLGENKEPAYYFRIITDNWKREGGVWKENYLLCAAYGPVFFRIPKLYPGDFVFCIGKIIKVKSKKTNDTIDILKIDYCSRSIEQNKTMEDFKDQLAFGTLSGIETVNGADI